MKLYKRIVLLLWIGLISACAKEEISNDVNDVIHLSTSDPIVQTVDWYHAKYINFYNASWGLKINALIENDDIVGVKSFPINRPDYNQTDYSWSKVYDSSTNEYIYRVDLFYTLEVANLDWGSGTSHYWWQFFEPDSSTEVDYFNDQSSSSVNASTTQLTYWLKRSEENAIEGPFTCLKGVCPE